MLCATTGITVFTRLFARLTVLFAALFAVSHVLAAPLNNAEQRSSDTANNPVELDAKLVIIMDDLGNNLATGRRAIDLPGQITYAILPHTPAAKKLAYYAAHVAKDKEVIIHMPMEAQNHSARDTNTLATTLDQREFVLALDEAIAQVPFAKGLSNHMGSRLTQLDGPMQWLMVELEKRGLYFVDSKTTGGSVALAAAIESDVPCIARDVFLDHDRDPEAINKAFHTAVAMAKHNGMAVLIGHPYAETLDFLEHALPTINQHQIELITVSKALASTAKIKLPSNVSHRILHDSAQPVRTGSLQALASDSESL